MAHGVLDCNNDGVIDVLDADCFNPICEFSDFLSTIRIVLADCKVFVAAAKSLFVCSSASDNLLFDSTSAARATATSRSSLLA